MTDGVAAFQPGAGGAPAPVRPRSAYARHEAFGAGDGAVLVDQQAPRALRRSAEAATQEGQIAGGLLYGRCFADEQGTYLVISGYLEAGPGENRGDLISRDGTGQFTLSGPDLRLPRRDAARVYSASAEAGWWRSLPAAGEFGSRDYETQRALVGPRGAGLLVFGAGLDWGTAYVGPGALPPSTARLAHPPPRLASLPGHRKSCGRSVAGRLARGSRASVRPRSARGRWWWPARTPSWHRTLGPAWPATRALTPASATTPAWTWTTTRTLTPGLKRTTRSLTTSRPPRSPRGGSRCCPRRRGGPSRPRCRRSPGRYRSGGSSRPIPAAGNRSFPPTSRSSSA